MMIGIMEEEGVGQDQGIGTGGEDQTQEIDIIEIGEGTIETDQGKEGLETTIEIGQERIDKEIDLREGLRDLEMIDWLRGQTDPDHSLRELAL